MAARRQQPAGLVPVDRTQGPSFPSAFQSLPLPSAPVVRPPPRTQPTNTPQFGIGQRALLLQTPHGNILWDLIAYLDPDTETWLRSLGGLLAIVISHPHYYTTYAEWSRVFGCPVYVSAEDEMWLDRMDAVGVERRLITEGEQEVVRGVRAVKTGGHFEGSLVLLWEEGEGVLFVADTLVTVPVSLTLVGLGSEVAVAVAVLRSSCGRAGGCGGNLLTF